MISKLAKEVHEGWVRDGLVPSLEMCVDLNAAGLAVERGPDASGFYSVPRVAYLGDHIFREPTVRRRAYIEDLRQILDGDDETQFCAVAYALYTPERDLVPLTLSRRRVRKAVSDFVVSVIADFSLSQVVAAVDYALNGADADTVSGDYGGEGAQTRPDAVPPPCRSYARELLAHAVGSGFDADAAGEMTADALARVLANAVLTGDGIKQRDADAVGRFWRIAGIGGAGKNLVETLLLSGQFIDALVATLVLRERLGAEVLTGLVGNIAIPKGDSISGGWIAEGSNAAKKNPTFGQITATPHTYGAYVDITRKLLMQSSVNVQSKILEWLMYACANGLETAAFSGSGANGQPKGVLSSVSTANTKAWANTPTFDKVVELIAAMKTANAYKPSMKFVGDAGVWAKLVKTRDYEVLTDGAESSAKNVAAIGGSTRLLDHATNTLLGREFVESNLMQEKTLLFGDFSQLAVCLWSGTDIVVDPYANSTNGGLRLVALQDSDILVKRPEAFCKATGVHA